ncbi:MAG: 8-oxo-dGTP diphosphatase [Parasporobacterium sp.]|nr:8-oxo-dGTP diphosphatase [Parasporobacterium sp.]
MAGDKINSTLCYMEKNGCFLMLYRNKKKNDPCEGKWVGVGGKFEKDETPEECLLREVREETGLVLTGYDFRGIVHFISDRWPDEDMYLYTSDSFEGKDDFADGSSFICDEGELRWIPKENIPGLNLWDGDRYFLEPLIRGKERIDMTCIYEGHKCVEVRYEEICN